MTQQRALKNAIRRRMAETGESYTVARAAILKAKPAPTKPAKEQSNG